MPIKLTDWIDVFDCAENKHKNVTPADLKQAERNYDPLVFHSPITTDHKEDGPAFGRLKAVKALGNKFFAKFEELTPQMTKWLKDGSYKYRSAEFYKNLNGKGFYPRAVSFVQFPECKSQGLIQLSEDLKEEKAAGVLRFSEKENIEKTVFPEGEYVCYEENTSRLSYLIERIGSMFQRLREKFIASEGIEKTDEVVSQYDIDALKSASEILSQDNLKFNEINNKEEVNVSPEELEKIKKQAREDGEKEAVAKFKEENAELLKFKENTLRKVYEDKFNNLVSKGKALPKHKEGFIAFFEKLDGEVLKFSEKEESALKFFEEYVAGIPDNTFVDLSGKQKYTKDNAKESSSVLSFTETDEDALHAKVLKFSEDHNISYEEALDKVIESEGK